MRPRVLIFDDDPLIRQLLWAVCDRRGYEVFTFPDPGLCPLHTTDSCPCETGRSCSDIIISDLKMPNVMGLDFVEELIGKGCRCRNVALMSGSWSDDEFHRAQRLGCKVFAKPFHVSQIIEWLDAVEGRLVPSRKLDDWHLKGDAAEP